ncbi:MAG: 30S ribosomal protein S7 [Anaerolineae bacterium]|nr:30S ribosomal protein S7 [Anaerolineae bacterium]
MPRRYRPEPREIEPDVKYNSVLLTKFVNAMMKGGKKSTAFSVMYDALELVEERTRRDPIEVFEQAMRNATPAIEVRPRRVGGSTYQIPIEVPPQRARALATRWLLAAAHARHGKSMAEKLAAELMDAANNQGSAIKKKDDTHRMAEANRAFAHYRW